MADKIRKTESKFAVCPFYRYESDYYVSCEGVTDDSFLHNGNGDSKKNKEYIKTYCHTFKYRECPIHCMLIKKYEEGEQ